MLSHIVGRCHEVVKLHRTVLRRQAIRFVTEQILPILKAHPCCAQSLAEGMF